MPTATIRHQHEADHDLTLTDLLRAQYAAAERRSQVSEWVRRCAARYEVSGSGRVEAKEGSRRPRVEEVPMGAAYEVSSGRRTEIRVRAESDQRWDPTLTIAVAVEMLRGFVAARPAESPGEGPEHLEARLAFYNARDLATEAARLLVSWDEADLAWCAARAAVAEHERGYTGWARFFLVVSSPGHVHSSMGCSSCRATTQFALVPTLSGCSEDEAVADVGEVMCTVCFPSAPTTSGKVTAAAARKIAEASANEVRKALR